MANIFVRFGKYAVTAIGTESKKGGRVALKLWVHLLRIGLSVGGGIALWAVVPILLYLFSDVDLKTLIPEPPPDDVPLTFRQFLFALFMLFSFAAPMWLVYCWLMAPIKWLREKLGIEEENLKLKQFTSMLDHLH